MTVRFVSLFFALAISAASHGQDFVNGGFENPDYPPGTIALAPAGTGWTFYNSSSFGNQVSGIADDLSPFAPQNSPGTGDQYGYLNNPYSNQRMHQTFQNLVVGRSYRVEWDETFVPSQGTNGGKVSPFIAEAGTGFGPSLFGGAVINDPNWNTRLSDPFTAWSESMDIGFNSFRPATKGGVALIDNVRLVESTRPPGGVSFRGGQIDLLPDSFIEIDTGSLTGTIELGIREQLVGNIFAGTETGPDGVFRGIQLSNYNIPQLPDHTIALAQPVTAMIDFASLGQLQIDFSDFRLNIDSGGYFRIPEEGNPFYLGGIGSNGAGSLDFAATGAMASLLGANSTHYLGANPSNPLGPVGSTGEFNLGMGPTLDMRTLEIKFAFSGFQDVFQGIGIHYSGLIHARGLVHVPEASSFILTSVVLLMFPFVTRRHVKN